MYLAIKILPREKRNLLLLILEFINRPRTLLLASSRLKTFKGLRNSFQLEKFLFELKTPYPFHIFESHVKGLQSKMPYRVNKRQQETPKITFQMLINSIKRKLISISDIDWKMD